MVKAAYELGVQLALVDAGLLPREKVASVLTAPIAPIAGAVAAPEGEEWRGASGASLGASLGGIGGALGGGLLGAGAGAGIGALTGDYEDSIPTGAGIGALLGGLGGSLYGGHKGYTESVMDDEKKQELFKKMLAEQTGRNS